MIIDKKNLLLLFFVLTICGVFVTTVFNLLPSSKALEVQEKVLETKINNQVEKVVSNEKGSLQEVKHDTVAIEDETSYRENEIDGNWDKSDNLLYHDQLNNGGNVFLKSKESTEINLDKNINVQSLIVDNNISLKLNGFDLSVEDYFINHGTIELFGSEKVEYKKEKFFNDGTIIFRGDKLINNLTFGNENYHNLIFDIDNDITLEDNLFVKNNLKFLRGDLKASNINIISENGDIILGEGQVDNVAFNAKSGNIYGNNVTDNKLKGDYINFEAKGQVGSMAMPIWLNDIKNLVVTAPMGININHKGNIVYNSDDWQLLTDKKTNINAFSDVTVNSPVTQANINITATENIYINAILTSDPDGDITLIADSDNDGDGLIDINANLVTLNGSVYLQAGEGIDVDADININNGLFEINGDNDDNDVGDFSHNTGSVNLMGSDVVKIPYGPNEVVDLTGTTFVINRGLFSELGRRNIMVGGDINNDGFNDFLFPSPYDSIWFNLSGSFFILFGQSQPFASEFDVDLTNNGSYFSNAGAGTYTFYDIDSLGDTNNDNYDDIILGSNCGSNNNQYGRAYVVRGNHTMGNHADINGVANYKYTGTNIGDCLGQDVAGVGDVNNDGYNDFLIGIPNSPTVETTNLGPGSVRLYLGGTGAPYLASTISGAYNNCGIGFEVEGVGDVNNDGYDDFMIGGEYVTSGGTYGCGRQSKVFLFLGKSSWSSSYNENQASAIYTGEDWYDLREAVISAAGDVNNDGYDDFMIGAHLRDSNGVDAGETYLFLGKSSFSNQSVSSADASFIGEAGYDLSGSALSAVGDENLDGYDDFLIGAKQNDANGANSGKAYLIRGKSTGWSMDTNLSNADASFIGMQANDYLGRSLGGYNDVDGDGRGDMMIASVGVDMESGGRVFYMPGGGREKDARVYSVTTNSILFRSISTTNQDIEINLPNENLSFTSGETISSTNADISLVGNNIGSATDYLEIDPGNNYQVEANGDLYLQINNNDLVISSISDNGTQTEITTTDGVIKFSKTGTAEIVVKDGSVLYTGADPIIASNLVLETQDASGVIGSQVNPIYIQVDNFTATAPNGIYIDQTGDITIDSMQASNGDIYLNAHSSIVVDNSVSANSITYITTENITVNANLTANVGEITLTADSDSNDTGDINLNNSITLSATGGSGVINLNSNQINNNGVYFEANGFLNITANAVNNDLQTSVAGVDIIADSNINISNDSWGNPLEVGGTNGINANNNLVYLYTTGDLYVNSSIAGSVFTLLSDTDINVSASVTSSTNSLNQMIADNDYTSDGSLSILSDVNTVGSVDLWAAHGVVINADVISSDASSNLDIRVDNENNGSGSFDLGVNADITAGDTITVWGSLNAYAGNWVVAGDITANNIILSEINTGNGSFYGAESITIDGTITTTGGLYVKAVSGNVELDNIVIPNLSEGLSLIADHDNNGVGNLTLINGTTFGSVTGDFKLSGKGSQNLPDITALSVTLGTDVASMGSLTLANVTSTGGNVLINSTDLDVNGNINATGGDIDLRSIDNSLDIQDVNVLSDNYNVDLLAADGVNINGDINGTINNNLTIYTEYDNDGFGGLNWQGTSSDITGDLIVYGRENGTAGDVVLNTDISASNCYLSHDNVSNFGLSSIDIQKSLSITNALKALFVNNNFSISGSSTINAGSIELVSSNADIVAAVGSNIVSSVGDISLTADNINLDTVNSMNDLIIDTSVNGVSDFVMTSGSLTVGNNLDINASNVGTMIKPLNVGLVSFHDIDANGASVYIDYDSDDITVDVTTNNQATLPKGNLYWGTDVADELYIETDGNISQNSNFTSPVPNLYLISNNASVGSSINQFDLGAHESINVTAGNDSEVHISCDNNDLNIGIIIAGTNTDVYLNNSNGNLVGNSSDISAGGELTINATGNVGSNTNKLITSVTSLDITAQNDVHIDQTGDLVISQATLTNSDFNIEAHSDITVSSPIVSDSVNLVASENINVSANIEATVGDLDLVADSDGNDTGAIIVTSGNLITNTGNNINLTSSEISTLSVISSASDFTQSTLGTTATINYNGNLSVYNNYVINNNVIVNANSAIIELGENWDNNGTFNGGSSAVYFLNNVLTSIITGDNDFYDLTVNVAGKNLTLESNQTQTVSENLTLQGSSGNLINLAATTPSQAAIIDNSSNTNVSYVNVSDNTANATYPIMAFNSNNGGNNTNWDFGPFLSVDSIVFSDASLGSAVDPAVLVGNSQKTFYIHGSFSDYSDCSNVSVDGLVYRTGVGSSCSADNNNCYPISSGDCTITNCTAGGSDLTGDYECTVDIEYYADATDLDSDYETDNWTAAIDLSNGVENITGTTNYETGSLLVLDVSTDIAYGALSLGEVSTEAVVTIYNYGNRDINYELSGNDMTCDELGSILVGNQRYSLNTGIDYNSADVLTVTPTTVSAQIPARTNDALISSRDIYWQIKIPDSAVKGICSGTNTFTGVLE